MFITLYRHVYKDIKLTKEMKNENPKAGKTIILLSLLVFFLSYISVSRSSGHRLQTIHIKHTAKYLHILKDEVQ